MPPSPDSPSPLREYDQRQADRSARASLLNRREQIVGYSRLVVFLVIVGVGVASIRVPWLHPLWVLVPVAAFVALLSLHETIRRAWFRARRAVLFYQAGLARLRDDWKGKGNQGARFVCENHPYAADIDLFGPGSLFELLCTARTRTGEDTLAGWLLAGAERAEILARQHAVAELRGQLDLREDLALLGGEVPAGVDFDAVAAWGAGPVVIHKRWLRWVALPLGLVAVTCLVGWVMTLTGSLSEATLFGRFFLTYGSLPLACMLPVVGLFGLVMMRQVHRVLSVVEKRASDLAMLANVLERIENAELIAPKLVALHAELIGEGGVPPSQRIAQLSNLIDLLNYRRNQMFAPFAYLMLWGTQVACAIEGWRVMAGPAIRHWLTVVGQFEALCALAGYAYENPDDVFPEVSEGGPCFVGEGLGHPLLAHGQCVPNDLALGDVRVLIVSGSNMSGKSTFLRTIGVNAVLALAGSVVRARRLRLSPLCLGATLRIQDSLQAGRSRFYAEILRVRQVVDLSRGTVPLLFLLDEIFAGTNSHDRRLGAEAVVTGLVQAGAIGLVTTHDLTLTKIAEELGEKVRNVHFADHFEDGVMTFDFLLQPGVVEKSNALALMRAVGLEV